MTATSFLIKFAMPHHATVSHARPRHSKPRHDTFHHAELCHVMSHIETSRCATPVHLTARYTMPRQATSRPTPPRHVSLHHSTRRHATPATFLSGCYFFVTSRAFRQRLSPTFADNMNFDVGWVAMVVNSLFLFLFLFLFLCLLLWHCFYDDDLKEDRCIYKPTWYRKQKIRQKCIIPLTFASSLTWLKA